MTIGCVEELRLSFLTEGEQLRLAAEPEDAAHQAIALFGYQLVAEPDGSPPTCDWYGRHDPSGGLADESLGGPANWACVDTEGCTLTRWRREPEWLNHQVPGWRADYERHQAAMADLAWLRQRAYAWYHPEQMRTWELNPEFCAALEAVRLAAEPRALELAEGIRDSREFIGLAADQQPPLTWPAAYDQPGPAPFARLCGDSGRDHTTMRCADARTWTLGHHRQFRGVTDAGAALGRKAVIARSGLPGLLTINQA